MERGKNFSYIHGEKCWPIVEKLSPCQSACPIQTDVPNYVMAISQGKFKEALEVVRRVNPFPSVCGRVCHHPCEEVCNRGLLDKPIAIQWLKRKTADKGLDDKPEPVQRTKKERIAVIGSGPVGLTAAYDLVKLGYGVTVYEANPIPGGMLTTGIPEFILPRQVALSEINYIKKLGVEIRSGMSWGRDFSLQDLWNVGYKAVLMAMGSQRSVMLRIPGADLQGVYKGLDLLRKVHLKEGIPFKGVVAVIGGGNVAMDAARTALRLGASEVHIACLESRNDMPAFSYEIEAAEREKIRIHNSLAPQAFTSKNGRQVSGIDFKRVSSTWKDEKGRISWKLSEHQDLITI